MEVKFLESEKTKVKVELVGETHTLPNILVKALWQDSDVDVAGYNLEHPQTKNAVLVLQTKSKDAKKVLLDAVARLKKENKELSSAFVKAAK